MQLDWLLGLIVIIVHVMFTIRMFLSFFTMVKDLSGFEWRYLFYAFVNGFAISVCYNVIYAVSCSMTSCDARHTPPS